MLQTLKLNLFVVFVKHYKHSFYLPQGRVMKLQAYENTSSLKSMYYNKSKKTSSLNDNNYKCNCRTVFTTEPYLPAQRSVRVSSVPRFSSRHCSRSMSETLSSSCCCLSNFSFFACFLLFFSACLSAYSDITEHNYILT